MPTYGTLTLYVTSIKSMIPASESQIVGAWSINGYLLERIGVSWGEIKPTVLSLHSPKSVAHQQWPPGFSTFCFLCPSIFQCCYSATSALQVAVCLLSAFNAPIMYSNTTN